MPRHIYEIAAEIHKNWATLSPYAAPYLSAMRQLDTINDMYGCDDARTIIVYFLSNATGWRGPVAKAIKAELKGITL